MSKLCQVCFPICSRLVFLPFACFYRIQHLLISRPQPSSCRAVPETLFNRKLLLLRPCWGWALGWVHWLSCAVRDTIVLINLIFYKTSFGNRWWRWWKEWNSFQKLLILLASDWILYNLANCFDCWWVWLHTIKIFCELVNLNRALYFIPPQLLPNGKPHSWNKVSHCNQLGEDQYKFQAGFN